MYMQVNKRPYLLCSLDGAVYLQVKLHLCCYILFHINSHGTLLYKYY